MSWQFISGGTAFFDLDDPRFTSPMSVISGLASGLCERRAAVDAAFKADSWGGNQTGTTQKNTRSNTVRNIAENIVRTENIGVTSSYAAGNTGVMIAPESWTQPGTQDTKTYMDYFDHELMAVANMYVTSGGQAYADFQDFAEHASARADDDEYYSDYAGYIVGGTATSGGSDYADSFTPAFRADWAAERRDMLEELMYSYVTPEIAKLDTTAASGGDYNVNGPGAGFQRGYIEGTLTDCWYFTSSNDDTATADFPYYADAAGYLSGGRLPEAYVSASYNLSATVLNAGGAESVAVTVYMADSYEYHQRDADYLCAAGLDVRTYVSTAVTAATDTGYCVVNGGTLTVPAGVRTNKVTVEAGGSIVYQGADAITDLLFLEQGATVIPFSSQGLLYRYTLGMAWNFFDAEDNFIIAIGSTPDPDQTPESIDPSDKRNYIQVVTGNGTVPSGAKKLYITGGANVTTGDMSDVYVSGATYTLQAGGECNHVIVDNGGLFIMNGAGIGLVEVLAGGTACFAGAATDLVGTLHVRAGGSAVVTGTKTAIRLLTLHDGSYFEVAPGVIDASFNNADGDEFIYYANIYHFCTFGLMADTIGNDTMPGWLTITATLDSGNTYKLYGVDTAALGTTKIADYINLGLGNMNYRLSGRVNVGNTDYSNFEAAYKYTSDTCRVHYGAQIVAKNRKADGGGILVNHYPEFTYRKFNDDEHE